MKLHLTVAAASAVVSVTVVAAAAVVTAQLYREPLPPSRACLSAERQNQSVKLCQVARHARAQRQTESQELARPERGESRPGRGRGASQKLDFLS